MPSRVCNLIKQPWSFKIYFKWKNPTFWILINFWWNIYLGLTCGFCSKQGNKRYLKVYFFSKWENNDIFLIIYINTMKTTSISIIISTNLSKSKDTKHTHVNQVKLSINSFSLFNQLLIKSRLHSIDIITD